MTPDPETQRSTLDEEAIRTHLRSALTTGTPIAAWTAVADIPLLLNELDRLGRLLAHTRVEFANLLAAARATLAAHADGDPDPLWFLRDETAQHQAAEYRTARDDR